MATCRITQALLLVAAVTLPLSAQWSQFRGPNASGISNATNLPTEFGPEKNVVWKTSLPPGHSSPIVFGDRIFFTAIENEKLVVSADKVFPTEDGTLWTICVDRITGKILWKKQAPRPRREQFQRTNTSASTSPVTDGRAVYVFFGDFGLLAYDMNGAEKWRLPLGPFINMNGYGTSPILEGDMLIQILDQDSGGYMIALNKETGKTLWKIDRSEVTRGYGTPVVYRPQQGPAELIVPGAYLLISYDVKTGEKLWWMRGMSWHPKASPVLDGDMLFVQSWESGGEVETPAETPTFEAALATYDTNKDGKIAMDEMSPRMRAPNTGLDPDGDGVLQEKDWDFYRARLAARNSLLAVKLGGARGDLSKTNLMWSMNRFIPNVPSMLIHEGVLYLMKEGGILTSLDPKDGKILKQARLTGALGQYWASPVYADGKIYLTSEECKITVLKPGGQWEIVATNALDDTCFATPAPVGDHLYIRTKTALYSFAKQP